MAKRKWSPQSYVVQKLFLDAWICFGARHGFCATCHTDFLSHNEFARMDNHPASCKLRRAVAWVKGEK